jgi:outer membrane protein
VTHPLGSSSARRERKLAQLGKVDLMRTAVPRAAATGWTCVYPARLRLDVAGLAALAFFLSFAGCANITTRPELYPDQWAPQSSDREWIPAPGVASDYTLESVAERPTSPAITPLSASQTYDLVGLIDIALRNNPETRRQWEVARSAAAQFGASQAPYYPQADVQAVNEYERILIELPGKSGKLEQWQSQPVMEITYTLLDFGRRHSAAEAARNRLIASNFILNRAIQDVVFGTQSAFYAVDAAQAAVTAAQQNLALAQTDLDAVNQRVNLGLATEPELLLAKERVAQSRFDLANAHLLVHDAEAQLAVALGIPANATPQIQGLEHEAVPKSLNEEVDMLIAQARRQRPDLAARAASLRAGEAEVSEARSQFFPVVGLSASYGENLWNYTFSSPRTTQTGQPQYAALLTLRWDIFTGFRRLNDLRQAEADREVARAELDALAIDATAQVWRAYHEFESSLSKYDYAQSLLAASQESYDANLETYREGLSTIVELLTAERDLANARYTIVQSKAELLTAYAAVAYAAGAVRNP